jgi:hypothetical protein
MPFIATSAWSSLAPHLASDDKQLSFCSLMAQKLSLLIAARVI